MNIKGLTKILPGSKQNINRLDFISNHSDSIRIAVFGKYNHGKSTFLNAMVNSEVFKASDKRETTKNKEYLHDGVIWIDTPGLDADATGKDDREAMQGAFELADFIFLVHRVDAGELDRSEMTLYRQLMKQDSSYKNKLFLILTCIDQVEDLIADKTIEIIRKQLVDLKSFPVSAVRYQKGVAGNKLIMIEKSGINTVFSQIGLLNDHISGFRKKEIKRLKNKLKHELLDLNKSIDLEVVTVKYEMNREKKKVQDYFRKVIKQIEDLA